MAIIEMKSGEIRIARKLQSEDDTLFAQNPDFSISQIPFDSVAKIEIRSRSDSEWVNTHSRGLTENEKDALTTAGVHGAAWAILVLPFLLLGWIVSDYVKKLGE